MDAFQKAIAAYLDALAQGDPLFARVYKSNGKDIPDCCNFIISEVKKTNRTGFSDEEVYGIAKHYFEEAGIKPATDAAPQCRVVTNTSSKETFAKPQTDKKRAAPKPKPGPEAADDGDMPEDIRGWTGAPSPDVTNQPAVGPGEQLSLF